jgi:porin
MGRRWMILVTAVLAVGQVRGQEPPSTAPPARAEGPPTASVLDSPEPLLERPSLRSRLASWRPISRWLNRTTLSQEPVPIGGLENPGQPVEGTNRTGPPTPAIGPPNGESGATQPGPGGANAPAGDGADTARRGSEPISSNPAAVNIIAGTGALGRFLGFDKDSGIRLGGIWLGDSSGVLSGGRNPGAWGLNSLEIIDLNLDTEKLFGWTGGSFGTELLQFNGQNTNSLAGAFPGFDSIEAGPPFNRTELYQLWYRQSFLDNKLIFRIGKSVPTFDFNNVVRPVPVDDPAAAIPAVTALAYTPIFVNPTMLGVIPGYYNSASGITTTFAPTKSLYLNYGFYDGNMANPNAALTGTGFSGPHFNGYYFHIGEIGYSYRLGPERKPGNFGVGVWGQTGKLNNFTGGQSNGANGVYLFGTQRLWFRNPGVDNSGVSGFYQFGANDTNALRGRQYVGGGLTAFGLVPQRPDDSFGMGLNCTWLTQGATGADIFYPQADSNLVPALRPSQLMYQCYYQMKLVDGWFFQTTLTDIPTPGIPPEKGHGTSFPNAFTITLRLTVLF